jgi:hypothetical protein
MFAKPWDEPNKPKDIPKVRNCSLKSVTIGSQLLQHGHKDKLVEQPETDFQQEDQGFLS